MAGNALLYNRINASRTKTLSTYMNPLIHFPNVAWWCERERSDDADVNGKADYLARYKITGYHQILKFTGATLIMVACRATSIFNQFFKGSSNRFLFVVEEWRFQKTQKIFSIYSIQQSFMAPNFLGNQTDWWATRDSFGVCPRATTMS